MKKYFWVLWFAFPFVLWGQSDIISVKGQVIDAADLPIKNAEVHIIELDLKAHTDSDGRFIFSDIPKGTYSLYAFYRNEISEIVTTKHKARSDLHVLLQIRTQHHQLEQILIQRKTLSESLKNTAIKATIVTLDKQVHQASAIEELVNRSAGVKIRNAGGLGASSDVIVGGFHGKAVKFLYDDIPIDYLGSNYGLTKLPVNMVDRIEIYKGVLPTRIGIDALGSAINVIPKSLQHTEGKLSYETGAYRTHIANINANIKLNNKLFLGTNSFYNYSRNNYNVKHLPYVDERTGQTTYITDQLFHNGFEQGSMEFYLQGRAFAWADLLELKINSYQLSKDIQNDPYSRVRAFGEVYRREKGDFIPSLKYKYSFWDNRFSISQFIVFSKINFELFDQAKNTYYDWKGLPHSTVSSSEMGNFLLKDGYLKNTLHQFTSRTYLNFLAHDFYQLQANIVYSHYRRASNTEEFDTKDNRYRKLIASLSLNSIFLDNALESSTQFKYLTGNISGKLQTTDALGVSDLEHQELHKTGISFSQALKYTITPRHFVRLSYENTYRLPEQDELFGDNNFIVPNFDLLPEQSNNINVGYNFTATKWNIDLHTYYRNTKNLIRLKDLNQCQATFLNLDQVEGIGIELEVDYRPLENLTLSGNLTWNDFRLKSSKDHLLNNQHYKNARIANMPFYYGNLSIAYDFKNTLYPQDNLSLYWHYSYVHQYYLDFIEKQFEPDGFLGLWGTSKINTNRIIPVQHLNNLGLSYRLPIRNQEIALGMEVKNIFNHDIYNEFKMQSPGRNYRFKITYIF